MFGRLGPLEIIVILAILLLVFGGRGKISGMMGDVAKGIKSFRKGMKDAGRRHEPDHVWRAGQRADQRHPREGKVEGLIALPARLRRDGRV